ncbi:uncharacterized protein LOC132789402 [Drosophila nasuta]|uniref:uncharacterized protein LOC132789402 n=1 Tax=Drosophila nasuta TaxID=42062 RepID=UPI00295EB757|nr:uncharacterized protein LOC132789402 [Drosophila nasuta]
MAHTHAASEAAAAATDDGDSQLLLPLSLEMAAGPNHWQTKVKSKEKPGKQQRFSTTTRGTAGKVHEVQRRGEEGCRRKKRSAAANKQNVNGENDDDHDDDDDIVASDFQLFFIFLQQQKQLQQLDARGERERRRWGERRGATKVDYVAAVVFFPCSVRGVREKWARPALNNLADVSPPFFSLFFFSICSSLAALLIVGSHSNSSNSNNYCNIIVL